MSYAAEAPGTASGRLTLAFNTIISERPAGTYVANGSVVAVRRLNNLFSGLRPESVVGDSVSVGDVISGQPGSLVASAAVPEESRPSAQPAPDLRKPATSRPEFATVGAFEECAAVP